MNRLIYGKTIFGIGVDAETRCAHYRSALDVIAIKFKCCEKWFSCFECHTALETHKPKVWRKEEFGEKAILCGACGHQLSIGEYQNSDSICPRCQSRFNPKCANHFHLYFET